MKKENRYSELAKPIDITEQNWPYDILPVVSVFNWVYNHKEFIRESIESILMQKTTFPVEIIIHDDASSDGTKEIILEYQNKHPHLFRNILHEKNQWSQGNSVMTPLFVKPKGKYIALTHGDDYWTDPLKLQKQVDFLEKNQQNILCFHSVLEQFTNGKINSSPIKIPEGYSSPITMAKKGNYIYTNSVVFRNIQIDSTHEMLTCPLGDYFLWNYLGQYGEYGYIDKEMAVYRNGTGIFSSLTIFEQTKKSFITFLLLSKYFKNKNPELSRIFENRVSINGLENQLTIEDVKVLSNTNIIFTYKLYNFMQERGINLVDSMPFSIIVKSLIYRLIRKMRNVFR